MGLLQGKVVLVTGTSSGIGYAAATRFAREGATVIAAARRQERGEQLVAEIRGEGGDASYVSTDVSTDASVDALFEYIEQTFGRLDCAFNNAAIEGVALSLPDTPAEAFDAVFGTNARGTWLCMRREMQIMRKHKQGVILNTAFQSLPNASPYVASKHAVVGMTKAAALDAVAFGVRVNCLCPGGVRTEMLQGWIDKWYGGDDAPVRAMIPMGRIGEVEELASVATFLLSDQSSYMTGAIVAADGGQALP
jgi:A-factor type gamma-butyrolactone 1'-reductase (1S-forming)